VAEKHHVQMQDSYHINPVFIFRWEDSQDAHVLLYPEGIVKLNDTAAAILEFCNGEYTVAESIDKLTSKFDGSDCDDIAKSIVKFLEASLDKNWIRINR